MKRIRRLVGFALVIAWLIAGGATRADQYSLTQFLNIESAGSANLSPNAAEIMYLTDITGVQQAWRLPIGGGYQAQTTFDSTGVEGAWWSTRDMGVMVVSVAPGEGRSFLYMTSPYGGECEQITPNDAARYTFGCWSRDGSRFALSGNARNGTDFDVYEYNVDAHHLFLVCENQGMVKAKDFSPDNRYLLMVREKPASGTDLLLFNRQDLEDTETDE